MRKWHRWITLFVGVFMFWIALTGVGSHVAAMYARGSVFEDEAAEQAERAERASREAALAQQPGNAAAPAAKPEANDKRRLVGLLHHLHSGEAFGPAGTVISLVCGLALMFFAVSGLWMYIQMFRYRKERGLNPRWLWE